MKTLKEAWDRVQINAAATLVVPSNLQTKLDDRAQARRVAVDVMNELYGLDDKDVDDFILEATKSLLGMVNGGADLGDALSSVIATTLMVGVEYGIEYGKEADAGGSA